MPSWLVIGVVKGIGPRRPIAIRHISEIGAAQVRARRLLAAEQRRCGSVPDRGSPS